MGITRVKARRAPVDDRHQPQVQSAIPLEDAMRDPSKAQELDIRSPKPREMIEQMRFVGRDTLTVADQALYEGMLAWATEHGPDKETHTIPLDAAMGFAGIVTTDALYESLVRLATTEVRYDLRKGDTRRRGVLTLVAGEVSEHMLRVGEGVLSFELPRMVREFMVKPKSYALLELAAIPRFSSRYSFRLYQRLALRAGYTKETVGPWEVTPEALAEAMNFPLTRYADFRRTCLEPALDDILRHVRRFGVACTPVYTKPGAKKGPGKPKVHALRFEVFPRVGPVAELKAAHFTHEEAVHIGRPDERIPGHLLPTAAAISRLVTYRSVVYQDGRDMSGAGIGEAWRAAVLEALSGTTRRDAPEPKENIDLVGAELLATVEERGLGEAMRLWVDRTEWTGRYLTHTDPLAPEPEQVVSMTGSNTFTADDLIAAGHRSLHSISAEDREAMAPVERIRFVARRTAMSMLEDLDTSGRVFFTSVCDCEVPPWTHVETLDEATFSVLRKGLRVLLGRVSTDMPSVRQSIKNLLEATAVLDLYSVRKISGAIIGAGA